VSKKQQQRTCGQVFLTPTRPTVTDAVAWEVERTDGENWINATLKFCDSSSSLSLDFTCDANEEDQNAGDSPTAVKAKIERLYREVRAFRAALLARLPD
jgi:hypothetical protein